MKRKPSVIGIAPQLLVQDVVKTAEYYRDKLGFHIMGYFLKPPAYAMVVRDGFQIHFGRSDSGESNSNSRQHAIISDFIIWVPEIHMFYEEIKANGVDIVQDIVKRIYGSREFVFRDCNGYKVTVGD